jgi:hypothetical protein
LREVFRLHILLEYINGDRDSIFLGVVWQGPNILEGIELIPSTWVPPDDAILGTWLILTPMVTGMVQQQLAGIGNSGLPVWWWDMGIQLSDRLIQTTTMMIEISMIVSGLLYFWDVSRGEVETYSIWQDKLEVGLGLADLDFTDTPL